MEQEQEHFLFKRISKYQKRQRLIKALDKLNRIRDGRFLYHMPVKFQETQARIYDKLAALQEQGA